MSSSKQKAATTAPSSRERKVSPKASTKPSSKRVNVRAFMPLTAIFDTETTDLSQNSVRRIEEQPHIYEFCVWMMKGDEKVDELDFRCKPGGLISEDSSRVTGVHNEDVADLYGFANWEGAIRQRIEKADEIVAHNFAFDYFVTNCEWRRMKTADLLWPKNRICTVEQTEHFKGFRLSLTALYEHLFGETFEQAHKASVDVTALTRCFIELRKRGVV